MPSPAAHEPVIGLEVHVQLATRTKLFCRCPNRYGAPPNTLVCPVCLGYPGALPTLNRRAVDLAVTLALALGASVAPRSRFARKNYFYPDLPKGYQITQYDQPLAVGGALPRPGVPVRLTRLHLEEDAGKLLHGGPGGDTLVDFNRCGVPLVEIVTEPELASPAEAHDLLRELHRLLRYTGVSDASMEEGSLRCDANVSLRPAGPARPGPKVEVKNLSSFAHVRRALEHEVERQRGLVAVGREVARETRSFDADAGVTRPLRGKEEVEDYRYLPEPDLPPLAVPPERRRRLAGELPELPWVRERRLAATHDLPPATASLLTSSPALADYFERAAGAGRATGAAVAKWVATELLHEVHERSLSLTEAARDLPPEQLAALVALVEEGTVSGSAAKAVLAAVWGRDEEPAAAVERLGLVQVRDADELAAWVEEVLARHPEEADRYRQGKEGLLGFFVGRVMERSGGRADPRRVNDLLRRALAEAAEREPVASS